MTTLYFCITDGMADFMPNSQDYFSCDSLEDMRETIRQAVESFCADYSAQETPYCHVIPDHVYSVCGERGTSSLNWRYCVARNEDRVLDIIGMTQEEYERESSDA